MAEGHPQILQATDFPTVCEHNEWMLQTKAKRFYLFRCMVCGSLWKTKFRTTQKCADFFAGQCQLGSKCPNPHIYSKHRARKDTQASLSAFRDSFEPQLDPAAEKQAPREGGADMSPEELNEIIFAAIGDAKEAPDTALQGEAPPTAPPPPPRPRAKDQFYSLDEGVQCTFVPTAPCPQQIQTAVVPNTYSAMQPILVANTLPLPSVRSQALAPLQAAPTLVPAPAQMMMPMQPVQGAMHGGYVLPPVHYLQATYTMQQVMHPPQ
eukprot:TRINITY_DN9302_c0_g1_i3.p1 TRINITY_DN9302_c0_g1~~TRINITY_DN9302_c0_g1_i3.p1  ORF type:complete len:265 (+),score=66.72 TRINITY_DN9302_c0_g1_i3:61-855(+)